MKKRYLRVFPPSSLDLQINKNAYDLEFKLDSRVAGLG